MNTELRKARNVKAMLRRKFTKFSSNTSWVAYKKQRNYVTKLRRKSLNEYFRMNCNNTSGNTFWSSVKPFMSDKAHFQNGNISLFENIL